MILLQADEGQLAIVLLWVLGLIFAIAIIIALSRWVFKIDKRVQQNDEIISLLKDLANKK